MIAHLRIPRHCARDLAIDTLADIPNIIAHDPTWDDYRHTWNGGANPLDVCVGQAVLQDVALVGTVGNLLLFGWFYAAQNHILTAQILDLLLRFEARSLANRKHRDD